MPRPKKNTAEKLSCRLPHVRCTEDEYAAVKSRAAQAGMTMSEYVRQMALSGGRVIVRDHRPLFDFAFVNQLQRIGVNINQQTRKLNATGQVSPELRRLWSKFEPLLDHIIEHIKPK